MGRKKILENIIHYNFILKTNTFGHDWYNNLPNILGFQLGKQFSYPTKFEYVKSRAFPH